MQIYILDAESLNTCEFITLKIGNGIFAAWLTAASIINFAGLLKYLGWNKYEQEWAGFIIMVALGIYTTFTYSKKDLSYGIIFFWVLLSIKSKHKS
jgi:TRAP-type C4-dicarboxylate transport system permease small subunit